MKKFEVSSKAAIFNPDRTKVILIRGKNRFGPFHAIPGGHLEAGETIEACIDRELYEECGIEPGMIEDLRPAAAFRHEGGKIILPFTGTLQESTLRSTQRRSEGDPIWVTKHEFEGLDIAPSYRRFVRMNFQAGVRPVSRPFL